MKLPKLEELVVLVILLMLFSFVAYIMVGCMALEPSEKEAIQAQAHKTVDSFFEWMPGGQVVNDVLTLGGMVWVALFGKKKISEKYKQLKDSKPGELLAKNNKK